MLHRHFSALSRPVAGVPPSPRHSQCGNFASLGLPAWSARAIRLQWGKLDLTFPPPRQKVPLETN